MTTEATLTRARLVDLLTTAALVGRNEDMSATTRGDVSEYLQGRMRHQLEALFLPEPAAEPWVALEHQGTAVHWDDASPGLRVFMVDWDEAEGSAEYTAEKLEELDRATYLPDKVRARLREQLER